MNRFSFINRAAFAVLMASVSVSVIAGGGGPRGQDYTQHPSNAVTIASSVPLEQVSTTAVRTETRLPLPVGISAQGKTRTEVYAELVQAERAGFVPSGNADYPPGPVTIERNLMRFKIAESWWQSTNQVTTAGK
ncbi:DUF4148 domain-containing protein [Burkholderia cepacia]|nr:DUF4148 domain-containing protein [Burkholderia cepacia]MBD1415408.1 DUF4148 domain-containing protein [Burkholderia contaminans]MBR8120070.1 DUF4148 domain-containing protein [Burkholderia cenocepacia]MBU9318224.1 DUF4148 domain-containing protein [Burkholderia multivorans]OXI51890.1 hypothetical protein CFB47_38315 [Burkholderia sp. AU27893]PRH39967.1 DUF4148 domain-containing protein [Burkholderia vietnamiensis]PZW88510.1 uncharacterized protein DUF4148 [Burkholderia sp. 28_3]